jgi:hypothetical protein
MIASHLHLTWEDSGIWKCLEQAIRRLTVLRTAGARS